MIGLRNGFWSSAWNVQPQAAVPEQVEDLLHHFLQIRRNFSLTLAVQNHNIDIAKRIQLATAISAKRNQCKRSPGRPAAMSSGGRSTENVL